MATHYTLSDYQAEHQQLAKMRGDRYCNGSGQRLWLTD